MYSLCRGALGKTKSTTAYITSLHIVGENNVGGFEVGSLNPDRQIGIIKSPSNSGYTVITYDSISMTPFGTTSTPNCLYVSPSGLFQT